MNFGQQIKDLRKKKGLTQEQFDSGTVCPQTQCDTAGCFQLGK